MFFCITALLFIFALVVILITINCQLSTITSLLFRPPSPQLRGRETVEDGGKGITYFWDSKIKDENSFLLLVSMYSLGEILN